MTRRIAAVLLASSLATWGCITTAGGALQPIKPPLPAAKPRIEQTVGDFEFTLEGGKMVTSNKAGRLLNDEILKRWKKKGYVEESAYVESSRFTGKADYNLTLSGSQYGNSSIAMQILSGLTLLILPYTVDTKYDIQYTIENRRTGQRFSASVADSYHTTIELLLFVAAPVAMRGADRTWNAMADHLYEQLRAQGAFDPAAVPSEMGATHGP